MESSSTPDIYFKKMETLNEAISLRGKILLIKGKFYTQQGDGICNGLIRQYDEKGMLDEKVLLIIKNKNFQTNKDRARSISEKSAFSVSLTDELLERFELFYSQVSTNFIKKY